MTDVPDHLRQMSLGEETESTSYEERYNQRYNPWGKTKRDQLQSWNVLTFDPQKTDVDEHIDLINTLDNILG